MNHRARYEYPQDRFGFRRWREAPGLRGVRYWEFDSLDGDLTLRLCRGDHEACLRITREQLEYDREGWRVVVARGLRQIRAHLSPYSSIAPRGAQAVLGAFPSTRGAARA